MKNFEIKSLEWDTDFFGVNSAALYIYSDLSDEDRAFILKEIEKFEFVTIKDEMYLESNGHWITGELHAKLVDVNMQFERGLKEMQPYKEEQKKVMIEDCMEINEQMIKIAEDSFIYSRFYNDAHIGKEKGKKVYGNWVRNAFNVQGKVFAFIKAGEEVQGFVLFSICNKILTIELICVDKRARRRHSGTALINEVIKYAEFHQVSFVQVGTQIQNIQAINFYFKNGFKLKKTIATYHLWVEKL